MRPHRTYSLMQPETHRYINGYLNDSDRLMPRLRRREIRYSGAILALALGLGLAMLVMLGTWWSLSTQATSTVITIVAHPDEQTLSADDLEDRALAPEFLDDILSRF